MAHAITPDPLVVSNGDAELPGLGQLPCSRRHILRVVAALTAASSKVQPSRQPCLRAIGLPSASGWDPADPIVLAKILTVPRAAHGGKKRWSDVRPSEVAVESAHLETLSNFARVPFPGKGIVGFRRRGKRERRAQERRKRRAAALGSGKADAHQTVT